MINRYELKSERYPNESIFVEYYDGILSSIILPVKHRLTTNSFAVLMAALPYGEDGLSGLADINLTVIKDLPVNIKLAMFCEKYMEYHDGEKYKATGTEAKQLKNYNLTYEILDHYYTSENFLFKGKHSVFNLTRYWNELIADMKNGGKKGHPNYYDMKYANSLRVEDLPGYWKHLRELGYEAVKTRVGGLQDWVKKVK